MSEEFSLTDTILGSPAHSPTLVAPPVSTKTAASIASQFISTIREQLILASVPVERSKADPNILLLGEGYVKAEPIYRTTVEGNVFRGVRIVAPDDSQMRVLAFKGPRTPGASFNYSKFVLRAKEFLSALKDYSPPVEKASPTTTPQDLPKKDAPLGELVQAPTTSEDELLPPGVTLHRDLAGIYHLTAVASHSNVSHIRNILSGLRSILG